MEQRRADDPRIDSLTDNVTRLTVMFEQSEKQRTEDRGMIRAAATTIGNLTSAMGEFASIKEKVNDHTSDIRTLRHDLNNALNALTALSALQEKINDNKQSIAKLEGKTESLEKYQTKQEGQVSGIKGVSTTTWVVGGAILTAIIWVLDKMGFFFGKQ